MEWLFLLHELSYIRTNDAGSGISAIIVLLLLHDDGF
jgi:hypothetical protein